MAYRRTEQAEPHGGGGQGLLAFGAVLLAGLLFAVGAVALLMSPSADASRTLPAVGAGDPTSSLPVFVQETPTPAPLPSATPLPSYALLTPTPVPSIVQPSFPSVAPSTSTPTATPPPPTPTPVRNTPRPTPSPTPVDTPPNCESSNGSDVRTVFLGYGNPSSVGPIPRAWCIREVIIRPFIDNGTDTSSTGLPGETRLEEDGKRLAGDTCAAEECDDKSRSFSPPHLSPAGTTFTYEFTCQDNPNTPETDECQVPGGATVEIQYEVLRGT